MKKVYDINFFQKRFLKKYHVYSFFKLIDICLMLLMSMTNVTNSSYVLKINNSEFIYFNKPKR